MAFPAEHQEENAQPLELEEAKNRAKIAATRLHWKLRTETETELEFGVGVNWKSWGEKVRISFQPKRILIHSECKFPTQCVDWGKNKENCRKFLKAYKA
ncbi:MAG: hypothetical protein ACREDS_00860 [Limisphaerales bacterium]